ncbi:discoidin domain-containing protein [Niabella ginsenosidivorans]|nr:discoidin domain-containing protein [Niabella ginsenosidivorans]
MRLKIINAFFLAALLALAGCFKDSVSLPPQPLENYIKVYMPQAVNNPAVYSYSTSDSSAHTIIYGANYGGAGYPDADIEVQFAVDAAAADSFNTANNTDYALLPEKSYKLSSLTGYIKKGTLSTDPLQLTVTTFGKNAPDDISKTYILPVSIKTATEKINESLRTFFCIIKIEPTFFNRTDWIITGFSSQESVGEGENNGRAIFILDDNKNTYWHSQWKDGQPGPPHYVTIDMGATKQVRGCGFIGRQSSNAGKPQDVQIFMSNDGSNWELAFTQTLQNINDLQRFFFDKAAEGRYVKLQINAAYGATYTHLAEFYLF